MTDARTEPRHVYLVRHGRTALNADGRLRGLADPPLDDVGVAEARAVASVIAALRPAYVFSSPLDRAAHTARIIAEAAGVFATTDDRFNDRDYGPWTGERKADVIAEWGSVDTAPGVEPVDDVLARARPALDDMLEESAGGDIVIVSHDAVIRPLITSIDPSRTTVETPTGSWNDLVRGADGWSVLATDQKPDPQPRSV